MNNVKKIKTTEKGKSPYLNDCFKKLMEGIGGSAKSNGQMSSNNSSAKSQKKRN